MMFERTKSAELQIQLGQRLALEKQICFAGGIVWRTYVKEAFQLSRERADELIRIGAGLITVDESRAGKKQRQLLSRRRLKPTDPSVSRFLKYAKLSSIECNRALNCVANKNCQLQDVVEMREAVVNAIGEWQKLFDVFDIA